ncbi:MAG: hypothetical protein J0I06_23230 [Planctomycetes bacterium]|nr:hypothetical protein [Planctomycetota bacterium]
MRARIVALVALVALISGASGQEFQQFASTTGWYKTTDIDAGKDKLKLTLDSVELKGDTTFLVSFVDATDEVAKKPAGPRLDKVRDGNKGTNGKVIEDKEIEVGPEKYPGRDILIESPGGYIRNRAVIAGNRLYQVMVQGTKDVVTSPSADKFINSFEITK